MAPDTPPLMLKLLEEPTVANAKAFIEWELHRNRRIQDVQRLIKAIAVDMIPAE